MAAPVPVDVRKLGPTATPAPAIWRSFREEMDQMFDHFSRSFGLPSFGACLIWNPAGGTETSFTFAAPAVDVTEDEKAHRITAELPGLDEKQVEISTSGALLVLRGEKRQEKEEKDKNYYMSERSYGAFERSFCIPEGVDRDKISAKFAKGVLTITLPKTAEAQKPSKKIEVKAA